MSHRIRATIWRLVQIAPPLRWAGRFVLDKIYPYINRHFWTMGGGEKYFEDIMASSVLKETHLRTQSRLAELLDGIEFESLLEVGCGFGWNLAYLRNRFDKTFVGCDFSSSQLEKARELYGDQIRFDFGDAMDLPYASKSFDVVVTVGCLIHIAPQHVKRAASEIQRVAKSYLIVMEEDPLFTDSQRMQHYSNSRWLFWHDYRALFNEFDLVICRDESPDLEVSLDTHFYRRKELQSKRG